MKKFLTYKKIMSLKLIKITCNLTGKSMSIYEDYYEKKIAQYGSRENLKKFYIQNKIINLIKSGHSIQDISNLLGFSINKDKIDYYSELVEFHRDKSLSAVIKESKTTFIETDSDVSDFINSWILYNNG